MKGYYALLTGFPAGYNVPLRQLPYDLISCGSAAGIWAMPVVLEEIRQATDSRTPFDYDTGCFEDALPEKQPLHRSLSRQYSAPPPPMYHSSSQEHPHLVQRRNSLQPPPSMHLANSLEQSQPLQRRNSLQSPAAAVSRMQFYPNAPCDHSWAAASLASRPLSRQPSADLCAHPSGALPFLTTEQRYLRSEAPFSHQHFPNSPSIDISSAMEDPEGNASLGCRPGDNFCLQPCSHVRRMASLHAYDNDTPMDFEAASGQEYPLSNDDFAAERQYGQAAPHQYALHPHYSGQERLDNAFQHQGRQPRQQQAHQHRAQQQQAYQQQAHAVQPPPFYRHPDGSSQHCVPISHANAVLANSEMERDLGLQQGKWMPSGDSPQPSSSTLFSQPNAAGQPPGGAMMPAQQMEAAPSVQSQLNEIGMEALEAVYADAPPQRAAAEAVHSAVLQTNHPTAAPASSPAGPSCASMQLRQQSELCKHQSSTHNQPSDCPIAPVAENAHTNRADEQQTQNGVHGPLASQAEMPELDAAGTSQEACFQTQQQQRPADNAASRSDDACEAMMLDALLFGLPCQ